MADIAYRADFYCGGVGNSFSSGWPGDENHYYVMLMRTALQLENKHDLLPSRAA